MFDDFDMQDEYCGFEPSDRDAWEEEQVFQDTMLERTEEDECWDDAEQDGFFDRDYDHDHGEWEYNDFE